MNCIDVHRKLTADPSLRDEPISKHLSECASCSKFAASINDFNQTLEAATNIDVPEGLTDRILLKHSFKQQHQQKSQRIKFYAIAASLFLVVGISFNLDKFNYINHNHSSIEQVALNHVINEQHHLHDKNDVQLSALNKMVQPFNLKFKQSIGTINYAGTCPIRKTRGAHIVIQNQQTTATLLLMPGEFVDGRSKSQRDNFTATIIPVKNGSIAIITNTNSKAELQEQIEKSLQESMQVI